MAGTKQLFNRDEGGRFTFQNYAGDQDAGSAEEVLQNIDKLLKGRRKALDPRQSLKWFRNIINQFNLTTASAVSSIFPSINAPFLGSMFFYGYDPKLRKKLPYYDSFPLVIPIATYRNGWLGLNLHYLDPLDRAALFHALLQITTNGRLTPRTKIKLTYSVLKRTSLYYGAKPCLKRYIISHVTSKIIRIDPKYWELALYLPVESFKKKPKTVVWGLSKAK